MRTLIAGLIFSVSLGAADREFRDVVDALSQQFQTHPLHIPMFGLVNLVTYVARPAGTKHIDLAVFENLDNRVRDDRQLAESVRSAVGGAWMPFVHARSAGEVVFVYMRPEGSDCRLLVVTVERHEAVVVELQLNPEALQRWVRTPERNVLNHFGHEARTSARNRDLEP